ncbi:MAG: Hint domain-containing protein [Paracoccaceae bacterium]
MAIATELPIDTDASALDMANAIFGSGIVVESATYSGDPLSSGIYSNGDTVSPNATPGDTGIILSTGHAEDFTNSDGTLNTNQSANTSTDTSGINGDDDFDDLANAGTTDASILEIEFTPTGDFITIDFVLSSEEYPEFINSQFNDVIGVWVNDTPATVSIGDGTASIGNINGGDTQNIYLDNTGDAFNTEMDGLTVTLTFVAPVNSGELNTLKIGIADVADSLYDSNLLIAGGSVQSTILAQADSVTIGHNDTTTIDVLSNDSSSGGTLTITHINDVAVTAGDTITLATGQVITLNVDGTISVAGDADAETVYFNYTIEDTAGNTDAGLIEINQVPCFGQGSLINTPDGPRLIETLAVGDLVLTRDKGAQPIRWIGGRDVSTTGQNCPILFRRGSFGATHDLYLSKQHRVMLTHQWAHILFDEPEVLVKAQDLVNDQTVRPDNRRPRITYFHILFDQHEVVTANGVACESYFPGPATMRGFDSDTQNEILRLFPNMEKDGRGYGHPARSLLSSPEARSLTSILGGTIATPDEMIPAR